MSAEEQPARTQRQRIGDALEALRRVEEAWHDFLPQLPPHAATVRVWEPLASLRVLLREIEGANQCLLVDCIRTRDHAGGHRFKCCNPACEGLPYRAGFMVHRHD